MGGWGWPPPPTVAQQVSDPSQVAEARRAAATICRELGFDPVRAGRVGIVVTEAANNILSHGGSGEILLRRQAGRVTGVELLALDRGRGIEDLPVAMADGHSTAGSRGTGLGAIQRQSDLFDLYTAAGGGVALLAQVWTEGTAPGGAGACGAVSVPKPGETECGDVWSVERGEDHHRIIVADGLGHGPQAREPALLAVEAARSAGGGPTEALEAAHLAARAGRGAAVAVADVHPRQVRYAGLGNVAGVLLTPARALNMVSINGTAGQGIVRPREFQYPYEPGTVLVMASDGISSRWSLDGYPGLVVRHPSLVAGVLYRDYSRRRDDATVVVVRLGGWA
jgi:anti-sigma regulatory factor (Ser/Thr protein kinase)